MSEKIYIDFVGGAHGNFLEFVCNKFIAKIDTFDSSPFNALGALHNKPYAENAKFICGHYSIGGISLAQKKVVAIEISKDDLLPLQCISLLRAGDYNIDPEQLEVNTFHKLNNKDYSWVLENLISSFFDVGYLIQGYNAIRDPSWPEISSIDDYNNLPSHIREECENVHGFAINQLDHLHPHCPRHILKEFFKIGFLDTDNHGFIKVQKTNLHVDCEVYKFPFSAFYNQLQFETQLTKIAKFTNLDFDSTAESFIALYQEFLARQPYRNAKIECDQIADTMLQRNITNMPTLNVIKEAYIAARLEQAKFVKHAN
jgi:hypothetical protein